jgi:energy-coupling factor transport system ATP-binding protein
MITSTPTTSLHETPATEGAIVVRDLDFSYGDSGQTTLLSNVSATFRRDRISVITGRSGSGKSTLLYLAAGLYPRHAGSASGCVMVGGVAPADLSPQARAALTGIVFQNPSLQFCMDTVENELTFCLGNACVPAGQMSGAVSDALASCGVEHLRHRALRTLSGGEKQLIALACVIATNPSWLLLDEPLANVDGASARALVRRLGALHRRGTGVLVVDHRLDYWADVTADVWSLDGNSGLVPMGPVQSVRNQEAVWDRLGPGHEKGVASSPGMIAGSPATTLEVRSLEVTHNDQRILSGVDVTFRAGMVYAITGRSGSGKSTFFDALLGVVPYSGQIRLDGVPLHRRRGGPRPGSVGFVTQDPRDQFIADTVYEEIAVGLRHGRRGLVNVDRGVERVLRSIGLWGYRQFSPYTLSQGQQRRLGVAALLAYDCKILVCDEPTYAQDPENAVAIMEALLAVVRSRGVTLVFSTHDFTLARRVADVVLEMKGGRLHEVDQPGL